ncbi:MAG: carbohydrate-binding domain-containing protein, partial [Prevotella sp.]|nr:carbohydrate-binding domain-containing protein [Prevotella sp.]
AGAMQVINSDASYSSGIKCDDFTQNGGLLTITATGTASRGISADNIVTNGGTLSITGSGAGQQGSSDTYTSKGLKADETIQLNAGTITIAMSGTGGKGIKSAGTYMQGKTDGTGPTLTVSTTGSSLGSSGGGGGGWGQQSSGGSSAKAIKVQGTATIYGGTTEVSTKTDGAEGLESKTSVDIQGGQHYFACYDDCINSSGAIYFNGGVTVCYSNGNDAVDSNYGRTGAITIGNGVIFAYTTKGSPEEGLDCDNNSYIQITGTGIGISAGGSQGGGGGGWGGSSSGNTISNAKQGYYFCTSSISYAAGRYYTLADASGNNLVTYNFPASCSSNLALFTATGMTKGSTYSVKYSTTAPTDATTAWHGLYLGSSHKGTTNVISSFTAQ